MIPAKFLLIVLTALVANVAAFPLQHGHVRRSHPARLPARNVRRSTCRKFITVTNTPTATSVPAITSSSSTAVVTSSSSTTPAAAPTTTKAASSSTTKSATSTTTKSSSSTSTTPTEGSGSGGGSVSNLFPAGRGTSSWSMAPGASNGVPLADSSFRPEKVLRSVVHTYTKAPDGKAALKAHYPKGSYTFGHDPQGGFSFYAPGPSSVDLTKAKEATFGYSVFFPNGFDPVLGGKLPGFYGGDNDEVSTSCSGGRRDDRCFSVRLMWRAKGAGEFYTYLPPSQSANKKICSIPNSDCNDTYGASIGRGSFTFPNGQWTTVSERVKLNDVGQANGEIELFANGKSVINVKGLVLRTSAAGRIRGLQMQTFFGGSKPQFASTKDTDAYFSDFSVAVTQTL
ncbi:polysaccharide lyase family 14 protein [Ephemerocybe angulata]|uniref:Polysaccharide lyase family 14 protein n=1 Tax=Ephemerocybe angulata TaxID=980116 RepID=A0A8H6MA98_9AGAR|nr:polysaccharide lyase family 14 protein [Tulosesus angulatus]